MALLDQLLSGLTGVSGSPLRGVLMNVLGHGGSQTGGAGGGLGGLLSSFEQAQQALAAKCPNLNRIGCVKRNLIS